VRAEQKAPRDTRRAPRAPRRLGDEGRGCLAVVEAVPPCRPSVEKRRSGRPVLLAVGMPAKVGARTHALAESLRNSLHTSECQKSLARPVRRERACASCLCASREADSGLGHDRPLWWVGRQASVSQGMTGPWGAGLFEPRWPGGEWVPSLLAASSST